MTSTKICIVSLPRSGSQYVSYLIENTLKSNNVPVCNIGEMFNESMPYKLDLKSPYRLKSQPFSGFKTIKQRIDHTLNTLSLYAGYQTVILRFNLEDYHIPHLDTIFNGLENANFTFIFLKRKDIEQQLVSYGISMTTNKWQRRKPSILSSFILTLSKIPPLKYIKQLQAYRNCANITSTADTKLEIKCFKEIKQLCDMLIVFETLISPLSGTTIYYETAIDELTTMLNMQIITKVRILKERANNIYQNIINADELKRYIHQLLIYHKLNTIIKPKIEGTLID